MRKERKRAFSSFPEEFFPSVFSSRKFRGSRAVSPILIRNRNVRRRRRRRRKKKEDWTSLSFYYDGGGDQEGKVQKKVA